MNLAGAPFIVAEHEHEVDLAIATVIPLIFLTALLAEAPNDDKNKRLQTFAQGFTIVFGATALVVAFLQLAGEQTKTGTALGLALLGATVLSAICAMAWRIVLQIGQMAADILAAALAAIVIVGIVAIFHGPDIILWILWPILTVFAIPVRIAYRRDRERRKRVGEKVKPGILPSTLTISADFFKIVFGKSKQNHTPKEQSSAVVKQANSADQPNTVTDDDIATKNSDQTDPPLAPPT